MVFGNLHFAIITYKVQFLPVLEWQSEPRSVILKKHMLEDTHYSRQNIKPVATVFVMWEPCHSVCDNRALKLISQALIFKASFMPLFEVYMCIFTYPSQPVLQVLIH